MRAIIKSIGPCRMKFSPPEFHRLAQSIVYQQLNGRAAETIFRRFTAMAGEPLNPPSILQLTEQQMRAAGLSKQKSAYLKDLAAKTANGSLNFAQLPTFSDAEVIDHLIQVKGIGVWTAQMFCPLATMESAWRCTNATSPSPRLPRKSSRARRREKKQLSCQLRPRWRRLQNAGSLIAAWPAGICGEAWMRKRFSSSAFELRAYPSPTVIK